jgi:hypothetical protein
MTLHLTKRACAALLCLGALGAAQAATTLAAGDLAFTGMARESAYGGWSFVSFVTIDAGTQITFSDLGLTAGGAFKTSVQKENTWVWTATSAVAAGTQVVVYGGSYSTAAGTVSGGTSGNGGSNVSTGTLAALATADSLAYAFDFSSSGETVLALQGSTFIGAMSSYLTPAAAAAADNPLASGLAAVQNLNYTAVNGGTGDGVISRTEWYRGPTSGKTAAEYKALIFDMANWSSDTATNSLKGLGLLEGAGQTAVLAGPAVGVGAGDFSISAVPEPRSCALLLAGLGMVGVAVRRRGAAL